MAGLRLYSFDYFRNYFNSTGNFNSLGFFGDLSRAMANYLKYPRKSLKGFEWQNNPSTVRFLNLYGGSLPKIDPVDDFEELVDKYATIYPDLTIEQYCENWIDT